MGSSIEYIAAGGNRHPAVADWDEKSGLVAYGADRNVALWFPQNKESRGVVALLTGHTDIVNAVKFFQTASASLIISGSIDKTVKVWQSKGVEGISYECIATLEDHQNSINCIAVTPGADIFATGSADAIVKTWRVSEVDGEVFIDALQTITITPRFFPLALALSNLGGVEGSYVLAVAGTKTIIQLYVAEALDGALEFKLQATLSGHEGWIRSLSFTKEKDSADSDLILSSASQDKYIRLWRIHQGKELPTAVVKSDPTLGAFMPGRSLSNKAHRFKAAGLDYSATFEALLLGHEDWIFSTSWRRGGEKLQLLSASADNSMAIWEPEPETGVWVSVARLGEISAEKGSTTATGSTGGFWLGLWSPSGETVACIGRTGGWRVWNYNTEQERWLQGVSVSGHIQSVNGIAWSKSGDYLLSTSSDQTTRLHAQWTRDGQKTWHEFARPQIHGYDLNCVDSLGESLFVSGAEEKLLRVFNEPKAVAKLLSKLCGFERTGVEHMPDAANMPVLGLSNKAIEAVDDNVVIQADREGEREAIDPASIVHKSTLDLPHAPLEDHLSRHTLWPEAEKLYGHGYEISALAASHDGSVVATACKASSIDHAVIRLFETKNWTEIKPALTAHTLTVARLRFSEDDKFLLSVGRDRQWAVFERDIESKDLYKMSENNLKGHSRMILDAAWAPIPEVFATAGRDKQVKIWAKEDGKYAVKTSIPAEQPVTAIDFLPTVVGDHIYLVLGTETGKISVSKLDAKSLAVVESSTLGDSPTKTITQLSWRPTARKSEGIKLAVASEDSSLRIYNLDSVVSVAP